MRERGREREGGGVGRGYVEFRFHPFPLQTVKLRYRKMSEVPNKTFNLIEDRMYFA